MYEDLIENHRQELQAVHNDYQLKMIRNSTDNTKVKGKRS
jgi:hypothetical protein